MADLQKDLLGLRYSPNFDISGMQEADVDLVLSNVVAGSATVYGTVTDISGPVADATVKVFDKNGLPFQHTLTDVQGNYTVDGLPIGTYSVAVVNDGYRMSPAKGVTLSDSDTVSVDFVIVADQTLALGSIAGMLTTETHKGDNMAIGGAKISLMNSLNNVVAVTYTVDDGEFAFYDVAAGTYNVLATLEGYLPSTPMTVVVQQNSIINIVMSMHVDSRTYNGTASGVIKDSQGNVVAGAFVGLYQITTGDAGKQTENLVATTKTNAVGRYLIGNVGAGKYVIKAKMNQ